MASKKRAPTGRLRWQIFSKSINNLLFSPLFITVTCLGIKYNNDINNNNIHNDAYIIL